LPNRIVVGPMDQYSAVDGCAGDWHLMHYGRFAVAGAGLVMLESAAVERRGRITRGCLGLYSDDNQYALQKVVAFCRRHGSAKLGLQIAHAGRKSSTRIPTLGGAGSRAPEYLRPDEEPWRPCGCTAQPRAPGWPPPEALDSSGLRRVVAAHLDATRRAAEIGFDVLELVMGHGYLLHLFLSPLSNERDDEYGGSLENRLRFPLQVFEAVRAAWPADRPLLVRISTTDWVEGGWEMQDAIVLCRRLKDMGCSMVTASTGGLSLRQAIPLGEGHQVPFAEQIRTQVGIPTMATGMIFDPRHADSVIRDKRADLVAIARGMLVDPNWAWRAAAVLGGSVDCPRQFVRGYRSRFHRGAAIPSW
jgi:2,4-dienoyl-CoA reductase-like NADH-dependent reductase (Old Yellow Enzyme family)